MDPADIAQIIRDKAAANGVDPAVLLRFGQIESNLNPNAGSDTSSAKGLFQFTNGTANQYGLSNPFDPEASADAAARLMKDNAAKLSAAGLETSPGALYLAHFAGAGGAQKLLSADPSMPVSSVLDSSAIKANPFLQKMTVADLKNWASGKMGGASPIIPTGQSAKAAVSPSTTLAGLSAAPSSTPSDEAPISLPAQQQAALPPPTLKLDAPPLRRIDHAKLLKLLSTPLSQRGFS